MSDSALLSHLCSICNNNKSKYRCPGCAARTCSLPCYKRHQAWAQCTGKRDPTKYVKKSDLATPAGIDHDFNFISSVERGLDRAERDLSERGLASPRDVRSGPQRGEVSDRAYQEAGVKVVRAPKGLSRHKENKTHKSASGKNIVWTVEWLNEDKSRALSQESAVTPLATAYGGVISRNLSSLTRKRKRRPEEQPAPHNHGDASALPDEINFERDEAGHRRSEPSLVGRPSASDSAAGTIDSESSLPRSDSIDVSDSESLPAEYHFFLLRPQTNSNRRILIPLLPSTNLRDCLRGRTVLEFPTIYVLSTGPDSLPDEFMLQDEYLDQENAENKELEELLKDIHPEGLRALRGEHQDPTSGGGVDSRAVLDVLKKDLDGGI